MGFIDISNGRKRADNFLLDVFIAPRFAGALFSFSFAVFMDVCTI